MYDVKLVRENEEILRYWHRRFPCLLVDATTRAPTAQYDLIKLLVVDCRDP